MSWRRQGEGARELYSVCRHIRSISYSSFPLCVNRAPGSGVVNGSEALGRLAVTSHCQARGGGRGGHPGSGGRGSRGSGDDTKGPAFINSLLTNSTSVQDILSIVKDNLGELNVVNVSTAFSRIGRMATQRDLSPRQLTVDEVFQGLLQRARDFARDGKFPARN